MRSRARARARAEGEGSDVVGEGLLSMDLALGDLVALVASCRRVHGRQLEGELEIRSSKRSWTI